LVSDSLFSDNKGDLYMFDKMDTLVLTKYFPDNYFSYSQSPQINILITPPTKLKYALEIDFTI
jgi:hypothetical protein